MKQFSTPVALLLLSFGTVVAQNNWTLDKSHSRVGFSVTHMGISEVEGDFRDFDATVISESDDFNGAEISFVAKVASINTGNERRDNHLKAKDFFNAEEHPELTFKGKLHKQGAKYKLKGDLTMHGVTKTVEFDVTYRGKIATSNGEKAGFRVNGTINRHDFGLTWSRTTPGGELVVSDEVEIIGKIEIDRKNKA